MTADCTFNSWSVSPNTNFLAFTSGAFTIDGNGHSIIGPSNSRVIYITGGAVLNLNNVIIRQAGSSNREAIEVNAGQLNGRNIIFRDNANRLMLYVRDRGQASLENVWFLNNRNTVNLVVGGSALTVESGSLNSPTVRITNAIFQGNTGAPNVIVSTATLEFDGCLSFIGNTQADGTTAATNYINVRNITDSNTGACPAAGFSYWLSLTPAPIKEEKLPTAAPTATPRPQIAATHVALQAATGATFRTSYGLDSGVHFRQLDGAGIGIQSIIDAGPLEAFDVYGYVEQGVEVCFPQVGRVLFLDARTMPRAITPLESTVVNGQTCVSINSPGSLVLMPHP